MRKRITRVSPFQIGKVFAVLYALISIPFVLIAAVAGSMGAAEAGMPMWLLVIIPIVYLVFGFIFTAIAAWLYNVVAGWTGGVEYTTEDMGA
jgi:formate-dependent nitrite reductase membrane component NrfD